ncbi:MAG: sulfurtransferase [Alphaproteobacteria bacterium]
MTDPGYARPELLVETEQLAAMLGDPAVRVLDCTVFLRPLPDWSEYRAESGRAQYEAGHIPGAVFADLIGDLSDPDSALRFTAPTPERLAEAMGRLGVGEGTRAVLYSTDSPQWATRLWWMLRANGFDAAAVLNGGFAKWRREGRPVSTEPAAYPPGRFVPRPRPGLFVGRSEVAAAIGDPGTCIVNALSAEQHRGEGGITYGRAGRIPNSVNVPARSLFDAETGTFLPAERLRAAFAGAGAGPDRRVVTYCGGGIAATGDAFALALLGQDDVAVYDASMQEWARDPSAPMEKG